MPAGDVGAADHAFAFGLSGARKDAALEAASRRDFDGVLGDRLVSCASTAADKRRQAMGTYFSMAAAPE